MNASLEQIKNPCSSATFFGKVHKKASRFQQLQKNWDPKKISNLTRTRSKQRPPDATEEEIRACQGQK